MNAREKRIALQRATLQTLFAIAASGCRFYDMQPMGWGPLGTDTLAKHVQGWQVSIAAAVCVTYAEACEAAAFGIESVCDPANNKVRGYRLIRLGGGPSKTSQRYSGETFRTADDLWTAMRTLADMREHPACAPLAVTPEARTAIQSIEVIGRRWFDSVNGNTYHVAVISIDGKEVHRTEFAYGYDDAYLESAAEWLETQGIVTRERYGNGGKRPLRLALEDAGIKLVYSHVDVKRRGEL